MSDLMNNKTRSLHVFLKGFFQKFTEMILQLLIWILGFMSIWGPIIYIWTSIIDKEFRISISIIYILGGISAFYITLALQEILKSDD